MMYALTATMYLEPSSLGTRYEMVFSSHHEPVVVRFQIKPAVDNSAVQDQL